MNEISDHALAVVVGFVLFGAVLGVLQILQRRRSRSVQGVVRTIEGSAAKALDKNEALEKSLREEDEIAAKPSLYGIPYLAWILTSLIILLGFGILFFENLVPPYAPPQVGSEVWFSYKAPAAFQIEGHRIERHQVLVPRGATATEADRTLVTEALKRRVRVGGSLVWGTLMLLVVFFFILLYHINILYPTSTEKNKNLILIYLIMLILMASAKTSIFYDLFSPYLIPVPWAGMAIVIFVNRRIVPLTVLISVIFVSIVSSFDFSLFLVLLAGGLVSGTWVRRARKRSDLMLASLLLGTLMALVFVFTAMVQSRDLTELYTEIWMSFINGALAGLMLLLFLPLFERLFDLTSAFRLMELLDLNTPLLKELFFKAPGTYQHSMAVANIGEMVASEIGVNDLLVRVGAYYHDIGKMFNPEYFIENQTGGPNPHDSLGPVASAAVVRSHVILGVKLGRQVKLPGAVIDFIAEHHGTSTIDYFFHKSKQLESGIKSERVFKYPGPKPQTKETALVMLVDSVEAASRVLKTRDEQTIRDLINKIAQRKLEQGELDRSGLTIGELKKIIDTLAHILKSSGHQRIVYPSSTPDATEEPAAKVRLVPKGKTKSQGQ